MALLIRTERSYTVEIQMHNVSWGPSHPQSSKLWRIQVQIQHLHLQLNWP